MSNNVKNISLEELMLGFNRSKDEVAELTLLLKSKDEEIEKLKKIIAYMKEEKSNKEQYDECAFDSLFESYDYYKQGK